MEWNEFRRSWWRGWRWGWGGGKLSTKAGCWTIDRGQAHNCTEPAITPANALATHNPKKIADGSIPNPISPRHSIWREPSRVSISIFASALWRATIDLLFLILPDEGSDNQTRSACSTVWRPRKKTYHREKSNLWYMERNQSHNTC